MRGELENDFNFNVTKSKLKKAKVMVLEKLDGSFKDECNKLEAYGQEQRLSNPGSDVAINISKDALEEGKKRFLRLYICFQDLKLGFKIGLRPLIGLDDDVSTVLPYAHHMYCTRHIEDNWLKKWRSGEMRKLMWWCAWSTYEEEFKDQLLKLGGMSKDVARDLVNYPPKAWCKAYFDIQYKNLMVDNNFIEFFNVWILDARHMSIIKMLQNIRIKVMERLADYEGKAMSWNANFSSPYMKLYNDYKAISHDCTLNFNGDNGFEITKGKDKHTVNLEKKRCTCKLWNLSGIPCPRDIKALMHEKIEQVTQIH
ncbi:uncharacterized protein LOC142176547 [Nicotiana tabacum]|uniref:Uncharacterized protein LOC142176547 n=1 Tax=Nicotiana tabacum TaxID=4097 RepID=A0AC58TTQ9_TOBAC